MASLSIWTNGGGAGVEKLFSLCVVSALSLYAPKWLGQRSLTGRRETLISAWSFRMYTYV
ncbi:hypothetical protein TSUD_02490 [Trifolium subterraneum]|uniref:Uncharacterized protein n=1 Tax=Trifolium subterraneum TaxID=3900 RepID=A0A2Z6NBY1_TRISU|nr:hypothetical protein TSUD_02490 [Trifolium subterraneum]